MGTCSASPQDPALVLWGCTSSSVKWGLEERQPWEGRGRGSSTKGPRCLPVTSPSPSQEPGDEGRDPEHRGASG